ncbi:hypothetical protein FEM33_17640 [Dyadobacter flavalbus]|uniref:Uncharacterized protein n=1 Tax=Dyadobacter flavalbus TaxID=2579942 RepID=A0A5M8QTZ3_9BACT|nr:hypothetical protein [Dyadobacter flavalbus]KAA6438510.1 hypothetical protein FEM33_17640 [Dyadobacter flavalbus]
MYTGSTGTDNKPVKCIQFFMNLSRPAELVKRVLQPSIVNRVSGVSRILYGTGKSGYLFPGFG